jgi:uncharacterized protein (TIGR00251 family)
MSDNPVKISIKVQPNAGKNEVTGVIDGVWRIKIAAPPDKGKANKQLIEFLSEVLKIKKDHLTIVRGHASHNKLVAIEELTRPEVDERLSRER